eukprot:SAG31_NODE_862_length_11416_cov_8.600336_12_plen_288_part_00
MLSLLSMTLALSAAAAPPCMNDENCSLNGVCIRSNGTCACFPPWSGPSCGILDELASPRAAAYGSSGTTAGSSPATWGADVLRSPADKQLHMFVSEMTGGCGLSAWGSNTQITHAVADTPLGPFRKVSDAIGAEATNPAVIVDGKGVWWLFHIGAGTNSSKSQKHCERTAGERARQAPRTQTVHTSTTGPKGPWVARGSIVCNNPAPALDVRDGSARMLCNDSPRHWSVHLSASGFGGEWTNVGTIQTVQPRTARKDANWEDVRIGRFPFATLQPRIYRCAAGKPHS